MLLAPRMRHCEREWSEEDIVKYLQHKAELLHHSPCAHEVEKDKDGPRLSRVLKKFSSYETALAAAGLKPAVVWAKLSNEELLEAARNWSAEHNGAKLNIFLLRNSRGKLPSDFLVRNRFGTVQNYFEQARVPYEYGKKIFNKF